MAEIQKLRAERDTLETLHQNAQEKLLIAEQTIQKLRAALRDAIGEMEANGMDSSPYYPALTEEEKP